MYWTPQEEIPATTWELKKKKKLFQIQLILKTSPVGKCGCDMLLYSPEWFFNCGCSLKHVIFDTSAYGAVMPRKFSAVIKAELDKIWL